MPARAHQRSTGDLIYEIRHEWGETGITTGRIKPDTYVLRHRTLAGKRYGCGSFNFLSGDV